MEEKDHPTTPDAQPPRLWCPGCSTSLPADSFDVGFTPIAAVIRADGSIELGQDVFLDYLHWECGTSVRISDHASWDEELGEYVRSVSGWLEVTIDGEYQTELAVASEVDGMSVSPFSGDVAQDPETWGPTLAALRDAYDGARAKIADKMGDGDA